MEQSPESSSQQRATNKSPRPRRLRCPRLRVCLREGHYNGRPAPEPYFRHVIGDESGRYDTTQSRRLQRILDQWPRMSVSTLIPQMVESTRTREMPPPPPRPPMCRSCDGVSERFVMGADACNARHPYYRCTPCDRFICFDDYRGNDLTNPLCDCGIQSKRQMAGDEARRPGLLHYVCRIGGGAVLLFAIRLLLRRW